MATARALRADSGPAPISLSEIGGGRVVRAFMMGGKRIMAGVHFTNEQIAAINPTNRVALLGRFIAVWPKAPEAGSPPPRAAGAERAERYIVPLGFGRFEVIEGISLTDGPVTKREAQALAGKAAPKKESRK